MFCLCPFLTLTVRLPDGRGAPALNTVAYVWRIICL